MQMGAQDIVDIRHGQAQQVQPVEPGLRIPGDIELVLADAGVHHDDVARGAQHEALEGQHDPLGLGIVEPVRHLGHMRPRQIGLASDEEIPRPLRQLLMFKDRRERDIANPDRLHALPLRLRGSGQLDSGRAAAARGRGKAFQQVERAASRVARQRHSDKDAGEPIKRHPCTFR